MSGTSRILSFALASTALHALILVGVSEPRSFALTAAGEARTVAVRLVPAGPATPDPAAQAGVAGSVPHGRRKPADVATGGPPEPEREVSTEPREPERQAAQSRPTTATAAAETAEPDSATAADNPPARHGPEQEIAQAETESGSEPPVEPDDRPPTQRDSPEAGAQQPPEAHDATETAETVEPPQASASEQGTAESKTAPPRAGGAEGRADRAQLAQRARRQVATELRRYFHYPRLARQRGWEGRVVLAFRVGADGGISDIEVIRSSGRTVLDRAAIESLKHVERIPEFTPVPGLGALELEVPVTYRLQPAA